MLNLPKPFFILAPMDDVTDTVFRRIIAECAAPDLCFSEFVNVDGLASPGRARLIRKLDRNPIEPPLVAHVWGLKPDNFYLVADQLASGEIAGELGLDSNFAGIDLNMGCPVRQVVKTGACSALIKNHELAKDIIGAVKAGSAGRLPVSVKTRIGFDKIDPEWTRFLLKQEVSMLSVHLRTSKEMSLVPAHYEELTRIVSERDELFPDTLIIANGDIDSRQQGKELAAKYRLDGVMIGRGVFQDPFVFSEQSPWEDIGSSERISLFRRQLKLFEAWSDNPDKAIGRMNKYAKIYLNSFYGAKELREQIAASRSVRQMLLALEEKALVAD